MSTELALSAVGHELAMMHRQSLRRVDNYLVCEAFAWGGMASMHFGRLLGEQGFSRLVAIKRLHAQYARDQAFLEMFTNEGRLLSRIHHLNVIAPLDVVIDGPELLVVMEYVHGESLARALQNGVAPVAEALARAILLQVLLGLHAAHEARDELGQPLQIVHRDVSPQNILIGLDGSVRVVDFGIAKAAASSQLTSDGALKGKPGYLAPEQLRREPLDRRTDVFAAGIVLWELLTGRRLFPAGLSAASVAALSSELPRPSRAVPVSPALDAVVGRALSCSPDARFATALDMATALASTGPVATSLELAAWVQPRVSSELSLRARRIAELEGFSASELTQAHAKATRSETTGELEPRCEPMPSSCDPGCVTLDAMRPSRRTSRRMAQLGFGMLMSAVAGVFALPELWQRIAANPTLAPAAASTATLERDTSRASLEALVSNREEGPPPPAPSTIASPVGESASSRLFEAGAVVAVPVPPFAERVEKWPGLEPPRTQRAARARQAPCDVPFSFGRDGVKRYNPECFR